MAIQWADNFDNYGTDILKLTDGLYAEVSTGTTLVADPDVLETGLCVRLDDQTTGGQTARRGDYVRKTYTPGLSAAGAAFRIYLPTLPTGLHESVIWTFSDINNDGQVTFKVMSDGSIRAYRGDIFVSQQEPPTLFGTSTQALVPGAWNHVETKILLSDTVGTVEIRVNGTTVLNLSNLDTIEDVGADVRSFQICNADLSGAGILRYFFKDLVLWDTTGTQNNNFLGTCTIYTLTTTADVAFPWTASTGTTGWDLIDETTPNDADYISAADPPPALSEFTLSDLPLDVVSVKAMIQVVRAKKIDGGDGNIQTGLKGTLIDSGANRPITSTFTYWYDISELSPDTGVTWTPVEVNNAKLTIDRTV
jgi:hypothetical protein